MAAHDDKDGHFLTPPAVMALRQDNEKVRVPMERSTSMDIRKERDDLKEAAEQSLNVILDLGLDGIIRWVSPSWKDVVGSPVESVKDRPITDVLLSNKDAFACAAESMKKDDSRSQIVRFQVLMGPASVLKRRPLDVEAGEDGCTNSAENQDIEEILNLEGQGIMVYDRSSGGESHVGRLERYIYVSLMAL